MTDTWHGGDLLNLRIYRQLLANQPEVLGAYSDPGILDLWLETYREQALEPFAVYLP